MAKMRKTIRVNEQLMDVIADLALLYNTYCYINVNKTNIMERLVIKGLPFYFEDIKIREYISQKQNMKDDIFELESRFNYYLKHMSNMTQTKILSFVAEEKIHECIELLAQEESRILRQNIGYNTLLNGMLLKGADYYIDFLQDMEVHNNNKILVEVKTYLHSLDLSLVSKIPKEKNDKMYKNLQSKREIKSTERENNTKKTHVQTEKTF